MLKSCMHLMYTENLTVAAELIWLKNVIFIL